MANGREGKLYEEIIEYIKEQIERGAYQPDDKLPTEQVLAQMFHVSRITSTRALNELQSMGLIVRRQGSGSYVASKQARGAPQHSEKYIAMIIPYVALQGRLHEILQGISDTLARRGYHLIIYNSGLDSASERTLLLRARTNGMCGIILYPKVDNTNIDIVYDMYINKFPILLVDKKYSDIPISNVCVDNHKGAYDVTRLLLDRGHRNIGFVTNRRMEEVYSIRERYFGYCEAMRDFDVPVNFEFVVRSDMDVQDEPTSIQQAADISQKLLLGGATALFAVSDVVAFKVLKGCESVGVRVPDDLSLVGFDNLPQCAYTTPPLTTCEQDFIKVGELAVELLLRQIEHSDYSFIERRVPAKLCLRESILTIE
ncbi:MAG: GntR family transcriptional regulator [Oscillospiraceae bacterium]|nr:GntR family transcriptional regulator [Oscillospiraceae bacterium]